MGAAFVGCAFESGGLTGASAASATGTASAAASSGSGPGGGATSVGAGGHGGAGASTGPGASTGTTGGAGGSSGDAGPDAPQVDAGPTAYASCQAWLAAHPNASNGVYDLLDGMGVVYQAYCEMTGDGGGDAGPVGGWTLVLKIDGTKGTFPYADPRWTNNTGYAANMPDLDQNEAKLASFWNVPFTALRVGMIEGGVTRWLEVPVGGTSLLDLVGEGAVTTLGRGAWEGLLAQGSLQTNCNWEGINAKGHVRIGIVGDESTGCQNNPSPDSFIGFGADTSFQAPSFDCGNIAHDMPDHDDQTTMTFGYVMVR